MVWRKLLPRDWIDWTLLLVGTPSANLGHILQGRPYWNFHDDHPHSNRYSGLKKY